MLSDGELKFVSPLRLTNLPFPPYVSPFAWADRVNGPLGVDFAQDSF